MSLNYESFSATDHWDINPTCTCIFNTILKDKLVIEIEVFLNNTCSSIFWKNLGCQPKNVKVTDNILKIL